MGSRTGWDNEIVLEGWIEKRGSRFHTWKRRWARLYMDRIEYSPEAHAKISGCWHLLDYVNIAHERSRFSDRPNCLCLVHPASDNRFFQPHKDVVLWMESVDAILHHCIPTILKTRRVEIWLDVCSHVLRNDLIDRNIGSGEYEAQLLVEQAAAQSLPSNPSNPSNPSISGSTPSALGSTSTSAAESAPQQTTQQPPSSDVPHRSISASNSTPVARPQMQLHRDHAVHADKDGDPTHGDSALDLASPVSPQNASLAVGADMETDPANDPFLRDTIALDDVNSPQLQWDRVSRIIPKDQLAGTNLDASFAQMQVQEPLVEETVEGCAEGSSQESD
eukprot:TRINITY_DN2850_c0_g1_i1.p1 TRINITY_DN2850_c0_g1~~TRINITY_DN2850_c0_g1_i1.p1  ORF type:complete len:334 (+),score=73.37 TRINITY_DN2850_c0_g1_i1:59-1060(+)